MRPAAACFAIVGLALSAQAQTDVTRLTYQVRYYDPSHDQGWTSVLPAYPGLRIEARAVVSFIGTSTVGGLGQVVFQPVISVWADSQLLTNSNLGLPGPADGIGPVGGVRSSPPGIVNDQPGVYGRIAPFGANATSTSTYLRGHLGTGTASGMLRIAQNHITNWIGAGATSGATANNNVNGGGGVSIAQIASPFRLPTDPPFNTGTSDLVVFKWSFILGSAFDSMSIFTPNTPDACGFNRTLENGVHVPNSRWFSSVDEVVAAVRPPQFDCQPAQIVIPAPATLGLFLFSLAPRRRRVSPEPA